ncbi:hypothetical protein PIB30_079982, partial [Stylosanthes scabra]|nr:hypothetical protein [Stylosanthes scabra]
MEKKKKKRRKRPKGLSHRESERHPRSFFSLSADKATKTLTTKSLTTNSTSRRRPPFAVVDGVFLDSSPLLLILASEPPSKDQASPQSHYTATVQGPPLPPLFVHHY